MGPGFESQRVHETPRQLPRGFCIKECKGAKRTLRTRWNEGRSSIEVLACSQKRMSAKPRSDDRRTEGFRVRTVRGAIGAVAETFASLGYPSEFTNKLWSHQVIRFEGFLFLSDFVLQLLIPSFVFSLIACLATRFKRHLFTAILLGSTVGIIIISVIYKYGELVHGWGILILCK